MSEDRAGLVFKADVRDEEAKKKLVELIRLGDNVNTYLTEVDLKGIEQKQKYLKMTADIIAISTQLSTMMGIQWSATQQLAINMIEQAAIAGMHALAMMETATPWMAPVILQQAGILMALQMVAFANLHEKGVRAQEEYFRAQQNIQIITRFIGS